jgi:sugar phosphate isomerase/epimerase
MSVDLSCNDYAWPMLSHEVVLAIIADLGFAAVDIGLFAEATHVTVSSVRAGPQARAEKVRGAVEARGLGVADVFLTASGDISRLTPTSRHGDDESQLRELFGAVLDFAEGLDAPGVTLLPGVVEEGVSVGGAIELAAEGLAPLVEMGAKRGFAVSVEPHVGSCIETPEAAAELMERCPGLAVTLDPGHFAFLGAQVDSMLALSEWVRHVQLRPGGPGVMQCKVPDNQIDFPSLVTGLLARGYRGYLASEFVWMAKWGCDETDNTSETARLASLLRRLLEEAK